MSFTERPRLASQFIFALSSMLAYLSRTNFAIKQIEKLSWDWIKMDCSGGKCYGLLAVGFSVLYRLASTDPFVTAGPSILLCIGRVPPLVIGIPHWCKVDENKASRYSKWVSIFDGSRVTR